MIENIKISILDILTILLPGAASVAILNSLNFQYLSSDKLLPNVVGKINSMEHSDWIFGAILIGVSYIAGHFIFSLASLLDSWIYDKVKKKLWKEEKLLKLVTDLRFEKTGINDSDIINAFQWSNAWLIQKQPAMYSVVERYTAESKFFRSMVIVFLIAFISSIFDKDIVATSILFFLLTMSLIRYLTRRRKSIESAYQFVISAAKE